MKRTERQRMKKTEPSLGDLSKISSMPTYIQGGEERAEKSL